MRGSGPESGGYTNARALSRLYGALASGAAQDLGVIGSDTLAVATQEVWAEHTTYEGNKFGGGLSMQTLGGKLTAGRDGARPLGIELAKATYDCMDAGGAAARQRGSGLF